MTLYTHPEPLNKTEEDVVIRMMDLTSDQGFFEHESFGVNLTGYIFRVKSEWGRGRNESFSINYIADTDEDLGVFEPALEKFVNKVSQIPDLFKAAYANSNRNDPAIMRVLEKLKSQARMSYKECVQIEKDLIYGHILTVGRDNVGKTTITNNLIALEPSPDVISPYGLKILKSVIQHTVFDVYDLSSKESGVCYDQSTIPDAIIFVIGCREDLEDYRLTVQEFQFTMEHFFGKDCSQPLDANTPVLILLNKAELCDDSIAFKEKIEKMLKPDRYGVRWQLRPVSAESGDGLLESFSWLVKAGLSHL